MEAGRPPGPRSAELVRRDRPRGIHLVICIGMVICGFIVAAAAILLAGLPIVIRIAALLSGIVFLILGIALALGTNPQTKPSGGGAEASEEAPKGTSPPR